MTMADTLKGIIDEKAGIIHDCKGDYLKEVVNSGKGN